MKRLPSPPLLVTRSKDFGDSNFKSRKQSGGGLGASYKFSIYHIFISLETKHEDSACQWINNPVLGDLRLRVFFALRVQIAATIVAYNLHDEIGSLPKLVANAAGVLLPHKADIGFTILSRPTSTSPSFPGNMKSLSIS